MKSKGLVYEMRRYTGGATPPLTVLEDASRYGSDGDFQASGHPAWVKRPSGLWELDFDSGTPDYVEIPASFTQLDFTSGDFSIIARVKVDAFTDSAYIFMRGLASVDGYSFYLSVNGNIFCRTYQSGATQTSYSDSNVVTTGSWFTVGMSRSGASVIPYANGVDVPSTVGEHIDPETCSRTAKIGIYDNLTLFPFGGQISYLAIWSRALPEEEHAARHYELSRWG